MTFFSHVHQGTSNPVGMEGLDRQRHNNRTSQELQQLHNCSRNKNAQKTQLRQHEQWNSQ